MLSLYTLALYFEWKKRRRGKPSDREPEPEPEPPNERRVPAMREQSSIAAVERQMARELREERGGLRRSVLALDQKLALRALRRRGYNDDIGCGGIVLILVGATVALPFAAEAIQRLAEFQVSGQLGIILWMGLIFAGFGLRGFWKARSEGTGPRGRRQ